MKTDKVKKLVFVAGADRHCCWFTALGDRLATESRDAWQQCNEYDDEEEYRWRFPDLSETNSPGTKLGDYIRRSCRTTSRARRKMCSSRISPSRRCRRTRTQRASARAA